MNKQPIYDIMSQIKIMKPSVVKEENLKAMAKLQGILKSDDYDAEEKIDGCRYTMAGCLFFSKEGVEKTDNFPHIRDFFMKLQMLNLILDGEINYPGKTSQYCTRVTGADPSTATAFQQVNGPIHYTMYDILRTPKGTWMINVPYKKRRALLEQFYNVYIKNTPMEKYIHITRRVSGNQKEAFKDDILASGGEGIVLKHLDSVYHMGKKPAWQWIKIKQADEADLIITGFEPPTMEYTGSDFDNWPYWRNINGVERPVSKNFYNGWIGAVEFSAYVNGVLTKICTASGMDEVTREHMSLNKEMYLGKVARVGYMELTEAGYPRHPKFVNLHEDKTPEECLWELN